MSAVVAIISFYSRHFIEAAKVGIVRLNPKFSIEDPE